ncbi:hypothetical protein [Burkholderia cepacia]|uniref:hypothetical protein n=1 Tax=Burkholderia cepacia TaxID=292 RepID=UPI00163B2D26|nr:hypothetical protein [Burkholderia cepacia]
MKPHIFLDRLNRQTRWICLSTLGPVMAGYGATPLEAYTQWWEVWGRYNGARKP